LGTLVHLAFLLQQLQVFVIPILLTGLGEPYYQTIHAIQKLLQVNARAIDTHLGGGAFGHLGLIFYDAAYAIIATTGENRPIY
jgi:hypothetical protein